MPSSTRRSVKPSRSLTFSTKRLLGWIDLFSWFVAVLFLMLVELSLLALTFLAPRSLAFWMSIAQFLTIPPHIVFFQADLLYFLWIFVLILLDSSLPWFIFYLGKYAVVDFLEWKHFSHLRQLRIYKSTRQQLAYLYMLALFENEQVQRLRQRKYQQAGDSEDDPAFTFAASTSTIQPVGPFSWFYLKLSNYLFPPTFPAQARAIATYVRQVSNPSSYTIVDHSPLQTSVEGDSQRKQFTLQAEPVEKKRCGCIYVYTLYPQIYLGEGKQIPLRIKVPRQLELLLCLATYARQQTTYGDDLVNCVYEWRYSEENKEQLQKKLHKDAAKLRKIFEVASQKAGLPYVDPITVEGRGQHAIWRLSEVYEVEDLVALETFYQRELEVAKKGREVNLQRFRDLYDMVISYYHGGFLVRLLHQEQVGEWAQKLQSRYHKMYRQILWDVAEYERILGMGEQPEEQRDCFKRAAQLYEQYAFEIFHRPQKLKVQEEHGQMSEYALQQSMLLYHWAGEDQAAYRVRYEYFKMMRRRFQGWTPQPQTEQAWKEVTQEGDNKA